VYFTFFACLPATVYGADKNKARAFVLRKRYRSKQAKTAVFAYSPSSSFTALTTGLVICLYR